MLWFKELVLILAVWNIVNMQLNESVAGYLFNLRTLMSLFQSPWLIQHEVLSWKYLAWSCPEHPCDYPLSLLSWNSYCHHAYVNVCSSQARWGWCFGGLQEPSFPLFLWVGCFVRVENKCLKSEHRCLHSSSHVWRVFPHSVCWQDGMSAHHCDFTDWHIIAQLVSSISSDGLCGAAPSILNIVHV